MPDELIPSGVPDPNNPENNGGNPPAGQKSVEEQLAEANALISDIKKTAGVTSVKELKAKLAPKPPDPPKPAAPAAPAEQGAYVTHEELALLQKGYSPEEIDVAKRLAPGKPIAEAVDDPTAKAAIAGIRQTRKTNDQVQEPSSRIPVHGGKSYGELTPAEQHGSYSGSVDALIKKGRNGGGNRSQGR